MADTSTTATSKAVPITPPPFPRRPRDAPVELETSVTATPTSVRYRHMPFELVMAPTLRTGDRDIWAELEPLVSDLAFRGNQVIQGTYGGFRLIDIDETLAADIEKQGGFVVRDAKDNIVQVSLARTWATDAEVERVEVAGPGFLNLFLADAWYTAAINVGVNPTFGGDPESTPLRIEAFLLDLSADLYDQPIRIEFHERLRDEERFESAEALIAQMHEDVERTKRLIEG